MASTFSTNLAIELIGTGDQAGTWGVTTNTNLGTLIEQAISGYVTQAVSTGADTTITIPNGATGVARNMYIELTGTGGTNTNLIVPSNKKLYFIFNNTSSGQVTVKVSGQTGVSVPNGKKMVLVCNGTDVVNGLNYIADFGTNSFTVTNLTASSGTITNLIATTGTITTLSATSGNISNLVSSDASATVLRAGSATLTHLSATSASITNLALTSLTISSLSITNVSVASATVSSNLTLSGGTANGVLYLNGSKVATSGSALVFDGTNLGIGTSSPAYKLDITSASDADLFQIKSTASANNTVLRLGISGNDAVINASGDSTGALAFKTYGTERMRLDSSGNLGIGTSSPSSKLTVASSNVTVNAGYGIAFTGDQARIMTPEDNVSGALIAWSSAGICRFLEGSTERMRISNGGNLGLGVTPSAWGRGKAFEFGSIGNSLWGDTGPNGIVNVTANAYLSTSNLSTGWKYAYTGPAGRYQISETTHSWYTAASGTAGNAITFTQAMTLDASGNLLVGKTVTTFATAGFLYEPGAAIEVTRNGGRTLRLNRLTSDGNIAEFNKDGTIVGSIASVATGKVGFYGSGGTGAVIDSTGNVGIGTASPSSALEVSSGSDTVLTINAANNADAKLVFSEAGSAEYSIIMDGLSGSTQSLQFYNNRTATEAMRISSAGNLGIGTSSPANKLHVNAGSTALVTYFNSTSASGAYSAWYNSDAVNGSVGAAAAIISGGSASNFAIRAESALCFATSGNTERARITSGGLLQVNTTSGSERFTVKEAANDVIVGKIYASGTGYYTQVFQITCDTAGGTGFNLIQANNSGGECFKVQGNGDVKNTNNSYGAISDEKTKQDIVDAASQWDDIKRVRVRKFRYKTDPTMPLQIGVVAQELEQVSPGLVDESPDYEEVEVTDEEGNVKTNRQPTGTSTKSVKYSILYMKAVKALQEAMARIEQLEAKVAALETK